MMRLKRKELCDLKAMVAINSAVRPYQDKLIQCEIDKAFTAGINYTDKKTCNVLYGQGSITINSYSYWMSNAMWLPYCSHSCGRIILNMIPVSD